MTPSVESTAADATAAPRETPSPIHDFLTLLFADASDERQIVTWPLQGTAEWHSDIASAAGRLTRLSIAGKDAYFAVALHSWPAVVAEAAKRGDLALRAKRRGYVESATVLPALFVDIDVASGQHKGHAGLPPTVDDAIPVLRGLPIPPSLIVNTGGGIHAYWLLREPWVLGSDQERSRAAKLMRGWCAYVGGAYALRSWKADGAVHDLARVLRPPGTMNTKYGFLVTIAEHHPERRYSPSDFDEWCGNPGTEQAVLPNLSPLARLSVSTSAQPPADKLTALIEIDTKFARTWRRQRPDLRDQSQSCYDFALTMLSLPAGWTDQEIVDLCVAHARAFKERVAPADEYARNLASAREKIEGRQKDERRREREASRHADTVEQLLGLAEARDLDRDEVTRRCLQLVGALVGGNIAFLRQFDSEPPSLEFVLADQRVVRVGSYDDLINYARFRRRMAEAFAVLPPQMKRETWEQVVNLLLSTVVRIELAGATEATGLLSGWISDYVNTFVPTDDVQVAAGRSGTCIIDGRLAICVAPFRRWLKNSQDETRSTSEVCKMLRRAGWTDNSVHYYKTLGRTRRESGDERPVIGTRSTRSYWVSPDSPAPGSVDGLDAGMGEPQAHGYGASGLAGRPSSIQPPNAIAGTHLEHST